MKQFYPLAARAATVCPLGRILGLLGLLLALSLSHPALAQTITSFAPTSGPIGTSVTITGTGFNATAAQNVVFFGATRATVTAANTASLTVNVPLGATYQYPTVTNLGTSRTAYARQPFVVTLNGNVAFASKVDFLADSNPSMVAIGDLNGDGKPDLVTADNGSDRVSVLRNTSTAGTVSFVTAATFSVGFNPSSVAIVDVNGDGKPDLVTANDGSGTVSVLRNTVTAGSLNAGSFATRVDFNVGSVLSSVAIGDADGDGKPDLVTANIFENEVSVLRNTGTGGAVNFAATVNFAVGVNPRSVAIGDVDGDGKPELVTANEGSDGVSVLRNAATAGSMNASSFEANVEFTVGPNPSSVAIGDVDGDGKPELVAANNSSDVVSVLRNTAVSGGLTAGSFGANAYFTVGRNPRSVAIGDVDGDGKPDLVTANEGSDGVSVLRNTGAAGAVSFAATVDFGVGVNPYSVAIGDVDGDGKPDLVAANFFSNTVSVVRQVVPLPAITSFNPTSGAAGTSVTLTGTGLSGATSVRVNGVAVTPTATSSTSLTFAVPAGASNTQSITVTAPGGTSAASTAFTVLLRVASTNPAANANAAPRTNSATAVTFTEPVTAASAASLTVFSAQLGGRKAGTVTVAGSTASFAATAGTVRTNFAPGEVVNVTVPASVASANGLPSAKRVYQFTTAAAGTGRGNFLPGANIANPTAGEVVAADFNGDGILDLADTGGGLQVRFGTGTGSYGAATAYAGAGGFYSLTAGDLDNDGDLDLVVPRSTGPVSIMRNDGAGVFTALTAAASSGNDPRKPALGDLDGDGDLDMLVPVSGGGNVGVYFNNGSGGFTAPTANGGSANSVFVVLGDVDNDGDLDYAVADYNNARVVVRHNNGSGGFSGGSEVGVGAGPNGLALADVNGDNALDILTGNENVATLSVSLNANAGTGAFGASSSVALPSTSSGLAVGDVDADGDLDVVLGSRGATGLYPCLNNGTGTFTLGSTVAAPTGFFYLALADLDNDGDLDLAGASLSGNLSVRLNQPPVPTLTAVSPAAELPGNPVTLTGANFTPGSSVSFGGAAGTGITVNSATSLTVTVPAGLAAGSAPIVVTAGGGPSAARPFTALAVYNGGALDACAAAVPATASLNDGQWHYLLSTGGQVVAAYNYTGASLGNLAMDVLRANPAQPVRRDGGGRAYLDRNFRLTNSAGTFTGRTVNVRFYGLNTEQARLQAADATATLANLKATQYSGPNEDCSLGNNSPTGERRVLAAPGSTPAGAPWFVAQVTVPDHFSEFYLTGSATPLPVELTAFTATLAGGNAVRLAWTTASEKNSDRFEVERSTDGRTFGYIATVPAAGSSSALRPYALLDTNLPASPTTRYYRLRQVDTDGTFAYSPVRAVTMGGPVAAGLTLSPNPGRVTTLRGAAPGAAVTVYDALGRLVLTATADAAGTARLVLPAELPTGMYLVRNGRYAVRLAVE